MLGAFAAPHMLDVQRQPVRIVVDDEAEACRMPVAPDDQAIHEVLHATVEVVSVWDLRAVAGDRDASLLEWFPGGEVSCEVGRVGRQLVSVLAPRSPVHPQRLVQQLGRIR